MKRTLTRRDLFRVAAVGPFVLTSRAAARATVKAFRTDRFKLILNLSPRDMDVLYDLKAEPEEMKNIAPDRGNAGLVEDLKRKLAKAMKEIEDPAVF